MLHSFCLEIGSEIGRKASGVTSWKGPDSLGWGGGFGEFMANGVLAGPRRSCWGICCVQHAISPKEWTIARCTKTTMHKSYSDTVNRLEQHTTRYPILTEDASCTVRSTQKTKCHHKRSTVTNKHSASRQWNTMNSYTTNQWQCPKNRA